MPWDNKCLAVRLWTFLPHRQHSTNSFPIASSGFATKFRLVYFFLGAGGISVFVSDTSSWVVSIFADSAISSTISLSASLPLASIRPALKTVNCSRIKSKDYSGYLSIISFNNSEFLIIMPSLHTKNILGLQNLFFKYLYVNTLNLPSHTNISAACWFTMYLFKE